MRSLLTSLLVLMALALALPAGAAAETTPPSGSISHLPADPFSSIVSISGTATDAGSGVQRIDLYFSGPISGTICMNPTLGGTPASRTYSCPWDTELIPDGMYTIVLQVRDVDGNRESAPITRQVAVDNTTPISTLSGFTEGTNPQYQHSSGSTMFFNPAMSGSFTVNAQAIDAALGIQRVDFPDLDGAGTLWTPGGASDTTSPYSVQYAWSAGATNPGVQSLTAYDTAGNSASAQFIVEEDSLASAGGSISYDGGSTTQSSQSIQFVVGSDTESGIGGWRVQRRSATLVADTCGAYGAWAAIGAAQPQSPFVDTTLVANRCYQWRLVVSDNVDNVTTSSSVAVTKVKLEGPDASLHSFTEGTNPEYQHADGSTMWINPQLAGSFTVRVTAEPLHAAVDRVEFPDFDDADPQWTVTPASDSTAPYEATYTWTAGLFLDGRGGTATAWDVDGNESHVYFDVLFDDSIPIDGSISYSGGPTRSATIPISFNTGTDGGHSGIGSWEIERREAAYTSTGCDSSFSEWSVVGGANPTQPFADSTAQHATCYEYRLRVRDNVGNENVYTAEDEIVMVDREAPEATSVFGSSFGTPLRFATSTSVAVNWTASSDEHSAVSYDVDLLSATRGASSLSNPVGLWKTGSADTTATLTGSQGSTYCLRASARDEAGNSSTPSADECTAVPMGASNLTRSSGWSRRSQAGSFLSTYYLSSTKGASMSLGSVATRRLAIIATRCVGCGKVDVFIGPDKVRTLDLSASSTRANQALIAYSSTQLKSGTVKLVVATSGKPVRIEAIGTSHILEP